MSPAQASNGAEAWAVFRGEHPRLILLDVDLPNFSGLEVLRRVRSNPANDGAAVVMLSSNRTSPEDQIAGLDAAADGYIARPHWLKVHA